MRRSKREVVQFKQRAINSLVLAIELFNRPHEAGRAEAVLMLLHHAFEMLLKAIIMARTGTVHVKGEKYAYGFEKCLEITQNELKLISGDERATLSILDAHRDVAVHYYQDMSEDILYLQSQAAITLFDNLLARGFDQRVANYMPDRVLPVSTRPPKDLQLLIDAELSQVDDLLRRGTRRGAQAAARLRPLLAFATATRERAERVTESEIERVIAKRRQGEDWTIILPEVAVLRLDTSGEGIPIYLRIKKDARLAVRVAKEGEAVVGTVIKHEINIWDKYNMGRDDLAAKLGLSGPKTSAVILELGIQDDPDCFKELRRKKSIFRGYSKIALDRIRDALNNGLNVDEVWLKHRHRFSNASATDRAG